MKRKRRYAKRIREDQVALEVQSGHETMRQDKIDVFIAPNEPGVIDLYEKEIC